MRTRIPDWFTKLAIFVGRSKTLKLLFRPYYDWLIRSTKSRRNAQFRKRGKIVLQCFDECMTKNGYIYTLAFGSMLGAVREHGFIKHDIDMDVALWAEDYTPELQKHLEEYGFHLKHVLLVNNGSYGREETYEKDGVTIDIFYIYPPEAAQLSPAIFEPYCCDFLSCKGAISFEDSMSKYGKVETRRCQLPWTKEVKRVNFEGMKLPICINAIELMIICYGDNYMIPNEKWSGKDELSRSYIYNWPNVVAKYFKQ